MKQLILSIDLYSLAVTGLEKGKRYMFRVSAKNEAGLGEPSRPTPIVECKPKYSKHYI